MDVDKRYYQNRQRKRKRTLVPSPTETKQMSPTEEERQFKLRRFTEDLGKFLSEKESSLNKVIIHSTKTQMKMQKVVKKDTVPKRVMKRGLFQNGMQTKFYTRGVSGVMTREMTARLDGDLHKIISLANNNQCENRCQCTHYCEGKIEQKTRLKSPQCQRERLRSSVLESVRSRLPPSCSDLHLSPKPLHSDLISEARREDAKTPDGPKSGKSLTELDKELYPLVVRVVSVSCTKTKSAHFKNQSYVSALKRKLLNIYTKGIKENKHVTSSSSEPQKSTSSVGTSPLALSTKTKSTLSQSGPTFKFAPVEYNTQLKSTMHFLEEIIGPNSTSSSKQLVPSPQCYQPSIHDCQPHLQCRKPLQSLLSPPVVGYERHQHASSYVPKATSFVHEPFISSSPSVTSIYNLKSKVFDGGGDGIRFNHLNSFLPPIEEEEDHSPDFRYYPRKIF